MKYGYATYCDECGVETDNKRLCDDCNSYEEGDED
jgi:hypothetical protein